MGIPLSFFTLLMGASDTEPGIWPVELSRRMLGNSGFSLGWGLSNISFIGSRQRDGVRYEGYGGWTFESYMSQNNRSTQFMIIYGDFSDKKSEVDQHSFYSDKNGFIWKPETIGAERMSVLRSFDVIRYELAGEVSRHLSFIRLASQYDMDYNCISDEFPVNVRNDKAVLMGFNGLHIATNGSHRIADAVARHLSARFSKLK